MFSQRKQRPTTSLLQDVSRAASRIAEESKSLAELARSELGEIGREAREQASDKATQARRATAARLAGAAEAVEPSGKKRGRRLPVLLSALAGGAVALKVAMSRSRSTGRDRDVVSGDEPGERERTSAPSTATAPKAGTATTSSSTATAGTNPDSPTAPASSGSATRPSAQSSTGNRSGS